MVVNSDLNAENQDIEKMQTTSLYAIPNESPERQNEGSIAIVKSHHFEPES